MSAKWRALQHRHRYTYSAVVFPSAFTDSLNQISPLNSSYSKFYSELKELTSLNSIYSQVKHAKNVASAFTDLLSSPENDDSSLSKAARFYLEVMFLENSLQLHRTLVSPLAKTKNFHSLINSCFRELCNEYGGFSNTKKKFCVSRVALSVMGMPKLGYLVDVVADCAVMVAWDVVSGLNSVVLETEESARPSPIAMEQCQEALSCLYYLLQRFPGKFINLNTIENNLKGSGSNVLEMVFRILIRILKSLAFSRDCYVAAGVSICAALQVCLSPQELGFVIIEGIFYQKTRTFGGINNCERDFSSVISKIPYTGDLCSEISSFPMLSRLCLIRGILTAVAREVLNIQFVVLLDNGSNANTLVKTILYNGILPELCSYCESPSDSHFNFHALTVMQICLQQIKTSLLATLIDASNTYDPIPEETGTRILRIIWNNLEDPLSQTVKQVHLVFDLFLDIESTVQQDKGSKRIKLFLQKIASDLLRLGPRCKGRYVPLASLTKRLGAKTILDMSPDLILETVHAYIDDDVCCAATSFLKCFLENFRDECWSSDGIEMGYAIYRKHCLPSFLFGLASGVSKLRSNLNTYALPVLLDVDVDSIFPMLAFISVGPNEEQNEISYSELVCTNVNPTLEQNVSVLISLLKVSRSLALIDGDIDTYENSEPNDFYAVICIKGIKVKICVGWLVLALTHIDESLRVDAAETLFLNPKTASLPSNLELTLMKEAIPLNMRCCSTAFQMKWSSLFRKFFSRVRTALERQFKQGSWKPLVSNGTVDKTTSRAKNLFNFMRWLSSFLFFSCYPSAPYKRKIMAMELIQIMMHVWSIAPSQENCLYPYNKGVTSPDSTLLLVASIVDSWDRLRESSFRILLHFPTPLPGISSEQLVCKVTTWAKKLVCSPRVRESDAGALTLRLIFRKYVLDLGWIVGASVNVVCCLSCPERVYPVIEYIKSLMDWLDVAVVEGERDLSKACRNSFVHGILLTLRYTFEELDWNSEAVLSGYSEMRDVLEKLLELVMRITTMALWVVSADAWHFPEDVDDMINNDDFMVDVLDEVDDEAINLLKPEDKDSKPGQDVKPSEQIVMVGCWLAMKEVSLLLGTITRKIPLPSSRSTDSLKSEAADGTTKVISDPMLDLEQLEKIGNHFLEVLLKMKHNGAIDKTRAGFTALCNRLLCSDDPRLCRLTESWMEQLMERTIAKGQVVDDLLRRSAGIPAAFIALFLAEPEGAPKKLLPRALRWLIDVAKSPLLHPIGSKGMKADSSIFTLKNSAQDSESNLNSSKIRDEGVVPTVHAFNILRAAFNDTNLATDTSGFSAEALIVSIRSFSSPYWEVRNSACLAYTALVRRMIGFLNVQKRESARRALTGLEFFHRYPSLHPFIFNELKFITEMLGDPSSGQSASNLANVVHPSLCPMLILLSRLKPSPLASESGDHLDPFVFMPFISRCSVQSNLKVRVLASRALIGLVSNEKLPAVILKIAFTLPSRGPQQASFNSIHGILLQLGTLLDINCRNLVDFSKKDQILDDLIKILGSCLWIASPKSCPCPILNTSFLRVLDHMLSIARTCQKSKSFNSIHNLLLELSTKCLDVNLVYGLSHFGPIIAELREQAAKSYFSCVYQASNEADEVVHRSSPDSKILKAPESKNCFNGLLEILVRSLSDYSYEVRLTTSKWLLKFLRSVELGTEVCGIYNWMKPNLQETLVKCLKLEDHHRCVYRILRILFMWNSLHFQKPTNEICSKTVWVGGMDLDSVSQLWETLISLYEQARHTKTRETLINCMAICIKRFSDIFSASILADLERKEHVGCSGSDHSERLTRLYGCITFYVDVIKQHSSSSEPVNIRKAASESVIASGLLEQAEIIGSYVFNCQQPTELINMYAYKVLELWFECTKLLEDEDDGIRQRLAMDVHKCFCSKRSGNSSPGASGVPTQVEKVIETVFEYLSSIFGNWIKYFDFLVRWVQNAANNVGSKGDLVRRVFDKEIDNHHEEKLLISQICCSQLEKIAISKSWAADLSNKDWIRNYLLDWRMRFCHQLMEFVKDQSERPGEVDWIGGIGNHKDAFLPLYGNLLGFYTLSKCILNDEHGDYVFLVSDVIELSKIINPYLRSPLICNLYSRVVKLHEDMIGGAIDISSGFEVDLIWECFQPYFLIE